LKQKVKVLFASGSEDLIPEAIEHLKAIYPELPLEVVAEFAPPEGRWTPYYPVRSFWENLARCRASFRGKNIRIAAIILQPRMPYWQLRFLAFALAPWNLLAFNENFGHWMLRPQSLPIILRHLAWRTRNFIAVQSVPGGGAYTFFWRLRHPSAYGRPLLYRLAKLAGWLTSGVKAMRTAPAAEPGPPLPEGISVVIPSRNGRDLLARMLPEVVRQRPAEVIVVDNGSDDGSSDFLAREFPTVIVEKSAAPLSFAKAVNCGIRRARFSHVCLLNNDMVIAPGFFDALRRPFDEIPDLFSSTAQIFFPPGQRRQETGKAVMPSRREPTDFPVTCFLPLEGEDHSYVLYGSGGCSLFDTRKLRVLGSFDEIYEPAYVEDLDLGVRAWERGWPNVFAAGAQVVHDHRTTTSRYYTQAHLDRILELNYLRFVVRTISGGHTFRRLWRDALVRINLHAALTDPVDAAQFALRQAWRAPAWVDRRFRDPAAIEHALAVGCGDICVTPGIPRTGKPVVLVVSPYVPFPLAHGGAVRMYNLMRRAALDFDQVLIAFVEHFEPIKPELRAICTEILTVKRVGTHLRPTTDRPDTVEEFDWPAFHAAVRQTVRKWKPIVAQLEFTQMAQYAADCAPAKTILVEHDVTLDLYQQLLAQSEDWETRRQLKRWTRFETAAWRQVDRVVVMSGKDQAMIPGSVCLANGVDLERFRPPSSEPDPLRLLFIGSFAHLPNVLAIEFFLRECWPRLQPLGAKLHVIAGSRHKFFLDRYRQRSNPNLDQPGIEVEDFVADVRPAYERAAIVVAPLLASAGTNIKIMEAMAMGKAIVSTPGGINGLDLNPGKDVIVAATGEEMASAIEDLLKNPDRRRALEREARQTVERQFDWDTIAVDQKRLYEGEI